MDWIVGFLASTAGVAFKGLIVAAVLDFIFGVLAAVRDGSFELYAVAAWLRKHLAGRVAPIAVLLVVTYYTGDAVTLTAAAAAAAAYVAETFGSIVDSIGTIRSPESAPQEPQLVEGAEAVYTATLESQANPVPTD